MNEKLKMLNIGCGTDKRENFINIDGSLDVKPDLIMDISSEELVKHFENDSVDYILANDIVEHFFHWEGVKLIQSFYGILKKGGKVDIRVPDTEYIIESELSVEDKIMLLYGGQDIGRKTSWNQEQDISRKKHPEFFCHKYGWTQKTIRGVLEEVGFTVLSMSSVDNNIVVSAIK